MSRFVALFLFVFVGCSPAGTVAPSPAATEGWFVGADSTRLFYRAIGRAPDTVVVVHGFQGNNQNYLAPDLLSLARGRTLLFYDQRGGGRSSPVTDPAQLGIEAHVRDLEALRQHFGFNRMALLGHSGGAAIATRSAVEYPGHTARLALVAPPAPVREPYAAQIARAFFPRVDSATWARGNALQASLRTAPDPVRVCREVTETVLPRTFFADSANVARMRGDFCGAPPAALRTQPERTASFQQSLPADWRSNLLTIRVPVLIVHGVHDAIPVAAARDWATALPDARLLLLSDADHLRWVEQPELFMAAVGEFFNGEWPRAAEFVP